MVSTSLSPRLNSKTPSAKVASMTAIPPCRRNRASLRPGGKALEAAPEIVQNPHEQPHEDEHGRDAALGGVLQIDVVQVAVPTGRQRPRNVGGHPFLEVVLGTFGADAEQRMGFDHLEAGAPGDEPKCVRVDALGMHQGGESVLDDGRARPIPRRQQNAELPSTIQRLQNQIR